MAFENRGRIYIASAIMVIASVLYIIANSLPAWIKYSFEPIVYKAGLWKVCGSQNDISTCFAYSTKVDNKMMATRAFVTICCILCSLAAIATLLIRVVDETFQKIVSVLAKSLAVASFISAIICIGAGTSFISDIKKNIGGSMDTSCILAIIGTVFNIVGTITILMLK